MTAQNELGAALIFVIFLAGIAIWLLIRPQNRSNHLPRTPATQDATINGPKPKIVELELSQKYKFMYENFLVSTQHDAYLMLEEKEGFIYALKFIGSTIKYGGPNDEARGAHPLTKFGTLMYGFYEVIHSPWIKEQMISNRIHLKHSDKMFSDRKHYIVCFKDVMFEASCKGYELVKLTKDEIVSLVLGEVESLSE